MPIYTPGKVVLAKQFTWNETVWNPSMIQTALWLDAADSSTVTTVSGAVSQWNDKSGNARHATQGTASRRPLYSTAFLNSKAVISFDGSDDILGLTDRTLGQDVGALSYSLVVIPNQPATTDYRAVLDLNNNPGSDRASIYFRSSTVEAGGRRLDADLYQFHQSGSVTANACITSVIFNYSSATLAAGFNGSSLSFRPGGFQTSGSTSNTNSTFISIGGTHNSTVDAFTASTNGACDCRIAEIVVLQSAPADSVRQRVEGYLAHKWGLTANLPAGHPYKTVGPTP